MRAGRAGWHPRWELQPGLEDTGSARRVRVAVTASGTQVWSYPNIRGDDIVTADQNGLYSSDAGGGTHCARYLGCVGHVGLMHGLVTP